MLSKKIETVINDQINAEFWSAYLYLSMSMHCANKNLQGASKWFHIQFKEEQGHAEKFMAYILSRGGQVLLQPIAKVETSWDSLLSMFKDTLAHEKVVTAKINHIYDLAVDEKDYATQSMLNWFIDEQIEEEETAQQMIDALEMIGNSGHGLYLFDKDLGARG